MKTPASCTFLDNFSASSSINRINRQKCPQNKTDMDDQHEAPENGRLAGWPKSAGSQVKLCSPWHGKSTVRALSWKPQVVERSGRGVEAKQGLLPRPRPNVSPSRGFNDKFGVGWLPFRTPSVSCHKAQQSLNPLSIVLCTLHCRTAVCAQRVPFRFLGRRPREAHC